MAIEIREAHNDEREDVAELLTLAGWNISADGLPIGGKENHTIVLLVDGELVGTLGIREGCRICNVTVLKECRGLHYGFLLMEASRGWTRGNPYLYVKMWNWKAIRLYLTEGYHITGRRRKSWKMEKRDD